MVQMIIGQLVLDPAAEEEARRMLREHFTRLNHWNLDQAVDASMSVDGATSRLEYLKSEAPARLFSAASNVLVSGMSAGSEMLAARRYGFGDIYGVEVDAFYLELCTKRLRKHAGFFPSLYPGRNLPYDDEKFDLVMSGHIIEHTEDPAHYLREHLRVLRRDGYLFLEFPTRFHYKELHTGLPSFEWLPETARNIVLRALGARRSPLKDSLKHRFTAIVDTGLKQVSLGRIRRWMRESGHSGAIVHREKAAPGIVRCLIRR